MKRFAVLYLLELVFLSILSGQALAIPLTFDLTGSSVDFVYPVDGALLTVTASWHSTDLTETSAAIVTRTSTGLGVKGANGTDTKGLLDGSGGHDTLIFDFGQQVRLLGIGFANVDDVDGFSLLTETETILTADSIALFSQWPDQLVNDIFKISVVDSNDSFRIASIQVATDFPHPTPEPTTWLLLAMGVGGLAFYRRKSKP